MKPITEKEIELMKRDIPNRSASMVYIVDWYRDKIISPEEHKNLMKSPRSSRKNQLEFKTRAYGMERSSAEMVSAIRDKEPNAPCCILGECNGDGIHQSLKQVNDKIDKDRPMLDRTYRIYSKIAY
jgi:hypothetical protein